MCVIIKVVQNYEFNFNYNIKNQIQYQKSNSISMSKSISNSVTIGNLLFPLNLKNDIISIKIDQNLIPILGNKNHFFAIARGQR